MFVGSLTYALYVSSFFYLTNWFYYTTAVVNGIGAGLLWPASVWKIPHLLIQSTACATRSYAKFCHKF